MTITNLATGIYSVAFTVPAGWAVADLLQVRVVADGIGRFVWGDSIDATIAAVKADTGNLVTRITSTLFSGITSLSSWLGAIAGKTADTGTRAEINATTAGASYNETTDSQEAIRERGDAAWTTGSSSGTGTGARTVNVTVNDGSTVLQNARVRLSEGASTYTGLTNASGVVVFNVDDATYTVAITKSGYTYAGTTLVVDGTEAVTYSMTATSVTPPDDPALCAVTLHLRNQYGVDLASEPVEITWVQWDAAANETPPVLSVPPVQTTDADGLVQVNLYREATYKIIYGNSPYTRRLDVTIPDAGTYEVEL